MTATCTENGLQFGGQKVKFTVEQDTKAHEGVEV